MTKFSSLKFETKKSEISSQHAKFSFGPLEKGFGITLGNSLRRTLLLSTPGTSVFGVKVEGASSEFSTLPGIKEDALNIVLNLKKLIVKIDENVFSQDDLDNLKIENWPVLKIKKATGTILASDIECPTGFTILNKNLYIATADKEGLSAEVYVTIGRGFKSFNENRAVIGSDDIIAVDANFSPIVKVGYTIDEKKVGGDNSTEFVSFDVSTNGVITPEDAVAIAANVLVAHYQEVAKISDHIKNNEIFASKEEEKKSKSLSTVLSETDMERKIWSKLANKGIKTLAELVSYSEDELNALFEDKTGKDVVKAAKKLLKSKNLSLK